LAEDLADFLLVIFAEKIFVAQADVPGLAGSGYGRHVCYAHAQHTAQPPISFQRLAFVKETVSQDFSKNFFLLQR
jgi:hypothetical protein